MHLRTLGFLARAPRAALLVLGAALSLAACSVHMRAEYSTGKGGESSSGSGGERKPAQVKSAPRADGRQSPAGRDTVVRATPSSKPPVEEAATGAGQRGVQPGTPAPEGGDGAGGEGGGTSREGGAPVAGVPASSAPPEQAESAAPGEEAPAEASSTGKTTRKRPSEPHVATPSNKPRKGSRAAAAPNKQGPRE